MLYYDYLHLESVWDDFEVQPLWALNVLKGVPSLFRAEFNLLDEDLETSTFCKS